MLFFFVEEEVERMTLGQILVGVGFEHHEVVGLAMEDFAQLFDGVKAKRAGLIVEDVVCSVTSES